MLFAPHTKDQNYALYEAQAYGNQLLTWPSVDAYLASDYKDKVVIRNKIPGDKRCIYGVTRDEVLALMKEWDPTGEDRQLFKMNELADDSLLTLQGEVTLGTGHVELIYSTVAAPMRTALAKEQKTASGARAYGILRYYLDDTDFEDLMALLDTYTGIHRFARVLEYHRMPSDLDDPFTRVSLEFSVWSKPVGSWHRRMVVWEIRNY